jgi:hypothetical protein
MRGILLRLIPNEVVVTAADLDALKLSQNYGEAAHAGEHIEGPLPLAGKLSHPKPLVDSL